MPNPESPSLHVGLVVLTEIPELLGEDHLDRLALLRGGASARSALPGPPEGGTVQSIDDGVLERTGPQVVARQVRKR